MRLSGQRSASAASINGSSARCSRTTPVTMSLEERLLGGQILRALDLAADPVAFELGEDFVQARAGEIHLVERLHGGKPRGAALVGLARLLVACGRVAGHHQPLRSRLSFAMTSAARAASAPLLPSSPPARALRLRFVLDGEDAVAERDARAATSSIKPARGFVRHDLEMIGLAANDAAERDDAVISRARRRAPWRWRRGFQARPAR